METLNFFDQGSPFLNHPLLTAERARKEVGFLLSQLNISPGVRLLDVGCGFGRHSIELARRGFDVVAIDPSATMLAEARKRAIEAEVKVEFIQDEGQTFTSKRPFDAAICLFTTLGQFSESGDNIGLVSQVYRLLNPGGQFMVELPQRDTAVANLKTGQRFGQGDHYTTVSRHFDPTNHILSEQFAIVSPENTRTYLLRYRLFNQAELTNLLVRAGFTIKAVFGDYDGSPLENESTIMIMVAQR